MSYRSDTLIKGFKDIRLKNVFPVFWCSASVAEDKRGHIDKIKVMFYYDFDLHSLCYMEWEAHKALIERSEFNFYTTDLETMEEFKVWAKREYEKVVFNDKKVYYSWKSWNSCYKYYQYNVIIETTA